MDYNKSKKIKKNFINIYISKLLRNLFLNYLLDKKYIHIYI